MPASSKSAFLLSLLTFATCGGAGVAGPSPEDDRAALEGELQAAVDAWAVAPAHVGVSAAVIFADGSEWISTAGIESGGNPLLPEHLISIASITKTMTGAVILQLVEEGAMTLEDPISAWMDPIPNVPGTITIRQLLNHTAGLANYTGSAELGAILNSDPSHTFTREELLGFLGTPLFAPGERTQYTNTAFLLLGMIAESVSGESINDLYQDRLFGPLGLTEIFMSGVQQPTGPVATGWAGPNADQATNPLEQLGLLSIGQSAFGMYSNARTVARWGNALFRGPVLQPSTRVQMLELVPAAGNIPGESGAGLGIRGYDYLGGAQFGHSGGFPLGSSLMLFDPPTQTTVVVIMNQGGAQSAHFALAPQLLQIVQAGEG